VLSAVLPWLIAAALVLLPVILRIFGEDDDPHNETVHEDGEEPELLPLAA